MFSQFSHISILTLAVFALDINGESQSDGIFEESRIVGGSDAEEGAFPYQVALEYKDQLLCGGSIIEAKWILTAAHCKIDEIDLAELKVVTGTTTLGDGSGEKYDVEKFIIHEKYEKDKIKNDVALIKLNRTITYNSKTRKILLTKKEIKTEKPLVLTGWGKLMNPGPDSTKLQTIELFSTPICKCQKAYPGLDVDNSNICTKGDPDKGACNGDSGGPLVYKGIQVGIVSFGIPCAVGEPDVFANVKYYRKWIEKHMRE